MQRIFTVSAYVDPGNQTKVVKTIKAFGPHEAATAFAAEREETVYSVRPEPTQTKDDGLYAFWSAGWSGSGQRIWVAERIGSV